MTVVSSSGHPREDGQVTVLILGGFVLLSLLLASVVMGASAIYLERKKLLSLADGAALAAADSYTAGDIGGGSGTPSTSLVDGRVLAATGSYLDASNAFSRHDQLAVAAGGTGSEPGGVPRW